MSPLASFVLEMLDRADTTLVSGWYHAVSVSTDRVRAWMRFHGLAFVDPARDHPPTMGELDRTAELMISRARISSGAMAGTAGLVGAASVPPEVLATMVSIVRLGQRLCIVYGFDPQQDRGRMALYRALAAAYQIELPTTGPVGIRVSDLPRLARRDTAPRGIGASLARAVALQSALWVAGRITRYVPVISATSGAVDARRRTEEAARRMQKVLRRLTEIPGLSSITYEDALELTPQG